MSTPQFALFRLLLPVFGLLLVACSHPVLLEKYDAVAPKQTVLAGRTVHVEALKDTHSTKSPEWKDSSAREDPPGYAYKELGSDQMRMWTETRNRLEGEVSKDQWHKLGHQRNGFGIPIKDVMSVNDPAQWLTKAIQFELTSQGAKIVDDPAAADLVVRGTLKHLFIDLYMATWAHGVVDFELQPRGGSPVAVRIHTMGGRTAWSGSAEESYAVLREMEQKLNIYLMLEIATAMAGASTQAAPASGWGQPAPAPTPTPAPAPTAAPASSWGQPAPK